MDWTTPKASASKLPWDYWQLECWPRVMRSIAAYGGGRNKIHFGRNDSFGTCPESDPGDYQQ